MHAVMTGDGTVGRFGFDHGGIGGHQYGCHQAEGTKSLGHGVGLHIAVVVLTCPDKFTVPFHGTSHHVIDQAMFISDACFFEFCRKFTFENLFEQVFKPAVIGLQNSVFGAQIDRPAAGEAIIHTGAGEIANAIVQVIHGHGDPRTGEVKHFPLDGLTAVFWLKFYRQFAGTGDPEVRGPILVTKSMTPDHNRMGPARHQPRHVGTEDRFPENRPAQNVPDGAIGRAPHLFEVEFLDPLFIGGDGGTFHADPMFKDGMGRIDGDLIVGLIAFFDAEIVISQVNIQIGQDQFVLDPCPDYAGHFIAVELDNRIFYFNFSHNDPL